MKWYSSTKECKWKQMELNGSSSIQSEVIIHEDGELFDGFGTCFNELGYVALQKLSEQERKKVLDLFFSPTEDGLRLKIGRIPIGASDYATKWYSCNETDQDYKMEHFSINQDKQYLIPYIKEAQKRNNEISFFASPWSPPTWMKFPRAYNYGTLIWESENLKAYALYFVKFIKEYKKELININQIHVQNEPMSSQKFPSCIWTGAQFAEFIGKYLGKAFEENNIESEIWLGTLNGPETDDRMLYTRYSDYANLVLHDDIASKYIKGVSYQWAGKFALSQTKQSFPNLKYMQSENECGNGENTWEYARYVDELFHYYITNGANSYIYWNGVLEKSGMSTWGWTQNSMVSVEDGKAVFNHEYYVMKHYSRFINKGARVLKLKGRFSTMANAFKNTDGSIVFIVTNPFKKEMSVHFEYEGGSFDATLPPDSLNTLIIE